MNRTNAFIVSLVKFLFLYSILLLLRLLMRGDVPITCRLHSIPFNIFVTDYWRARKICDVNKKPLTTSVDVTKQQNVESSKTTKTTTTTATITKTT